MPNTNYDNMTVEELEREIRACRDVLSDTTEKIVSALEGIVNCTSATGIIAFLKSITGDVIQTVAYRVSIRQQMNDMQEALDARGGGGNEATQEEEPAE